MEGCGVVPTRSQVNDAILVGRVEFGELFREGLNWGKSELERELHDRPLFFGVQPLANR